jgi:hypothetical protein
LLRSLCSCSNAETQGLKFKDPSFIQCREHRALSVVMGLDTSAKKQGHTG